MGGCDYYGIMSTDADFTSADDRTALPAGTDTADANQLPEIVKQLLAREAQLVAALNASTQTVEQQRELLDKLTHELALMKRWVFGSRRERCIRPVNTTAPFRSPAGRRGGGQPVRRSAGARLGPSQSGYFACCC
jgi:hypothetical protein